MQQDEARARLQAMADSNSIEAGYGAFSHRNATMIADVRNLLAFAAPPAVERVKHAWDAGYSTGQTYANDPPFAGLGKHNRQHGWELYACSLTDRNLPATDSPTLHPSDREAIARTFLASWYEWHGEVQPWWDALFEDQRARALRAAAAILALSGSLAPANPTEKGEK